MTLRKIPFDGLCLRRILAEIRALGPVEFGDMRLVGPRCIVLTLRAGGRPTRWVVDLRPEFLRFHRTQIRFGETMEAPFSRTVNSRLRGAALIGASQFGLDRIAALEFHGPSGRLDLILELTGRHANAVLVAESGRIEAVVTQVSGERTLRVGGDYAFPPNAQFAVGAAPPPTLQGLGVPMDQALSMANDASQPGYWLPEVGAYPLVLPEGLTLPHLSDALERHFADRVVAAELDQARRSLLTALGRVAEARRRALDQVKKARAHADSARHWQEQAELILAHAPSLPIGADRPETMDYRGETIVIELDPDSTPVENAARLFEKAKKAKAAFAALADQEKRLADDLYDVQALVVRVEAVTAVSELEPLRAEADRRRWLHRSKAEVERDPKSDLPPAARRVRELLGPGGVRVLYGETAEANDYLTLHIAKPWDWWLHVRGATSAHVVIPTQKKPERVGPEVLRFAAEVAVRHSTLKHSRYVPVDYTLKKYVRKPRGSAKGAVTYTHEKTIHVRDA